MEEYLKTVERYKESQDNLIKQLKENNTLMEEIIKTQMTIINFYKERSQNNI